MTKTTLQSQYGGTAVELAFVIPILVLLIFGIIEFSLLIYNKTMITNAAREGARYGVVWAPEENLRMTQSNIQLVVENFLGNRLISFNPDNTDAIAVVTNGACGDFDVYEPLTVTVTYPYYFLTLPIGPISLSSEANMLCEAVVAQ